MTHGFSRWLMLVCLVCCGFSGCGSGESTPVAANIEGGDQNQSAASGNAQEQPKEVTPIVRIETSLGNITIKLDPAKAPLTVENFLTYVKSGHYHGTIIHQAVDGYIVLGGGFTKDLQEKPAQTPIRNEAQNGLSNRRGTIAMARQFDIIDSSTCQFFINLGDNSALDHKGQSVEEYGYCVFGEVVDGLDVADKISKMPVKDIEGFELLPVQTVTINAIRLVQ